MNARTRAHILGEVVFDVGFASEEEAFAQHTELGGFLQKRLLPVINEVFDELGTGAVYRLDSLELDLGEVAKTGYDAELEQRLRERLRTLLLARLPNAQAAPQPGAVIRTEEGAELECFTYFLEHGRMPWNAARPLTERLDALAQKVLLDSLANFVTYLREKSPGERELVSRRLIGQFGNDILQQLAAALAPAHAPLIERLTAHVHGTSTRTPGVSERTLRRVYWTALLSALLDPGTRGGHAEALVDELLRGMAARTGKGMLLDSMLRGDTAEMSSPRLGPPDHRGPRHTGTFRQQGTGPAEAFFHRFATALADLFVQDRHAVATAVPMGVPFSAPSGGAANLEGVFAQGGASTLEGTLNLKASLRHAFRHGSADVIDEHWRKLIASHPDWVRDVLRRSCALRSVRVRLACILSEKTLREAVGLLAPRAEASVFQWAAYAERFAVSSSSTAGEDLGAEQLFWTFSLAYVALECRGRFQKGDFFTSLLRQRVAHSGLTTERVLRDWRRAWEAPASDTAVRAQVLGLVKDAARLKETSTPTEFSHSEELLRGYELLDFVRTSLQSSGRGAVDTEQLTRVLDELTKRHRPLARQLLWELDPGETFGDSDKPSYVAERLRALIAEQRLPGSDGSPTESPRVRSAERGAMFDHLSNRFADALHRLAGALDALSSGATVDVTQTTTDIEYLLRRAPERLAALFKGGPDNGDVLDWVLARLPVRMRSRLRLLLASSSAGDGSAQLLKLIRDHIVADGGTSMRDVEHHAAKASDRNAFYRGIMRAFIQDQPLELEAVLSGKNASTALNRTVGDPGRTERPGGSVPIGSETRRERYSPVVGDVAGAAQAETGVVDTGSPRREAPGVRSRHPGARYDTGSHAGTMAQEQDTDQVAAEAHDVSPRGGSELPALPTSEAHRAERGISTAAEISSSASLSNDGVAQGLDARLHDGFAGGASSGAVRDGEQSRRLASEVRKLLREPWGAVVDRLADLANDGVAAQRLFAQLPEGLARRLHLAFHGSTADSAAALLGLIREHLLAGREANETTIGEFMRTIEGHAAEASHPKYFLRQVIQALVQERVVDLSTILAEESASGASRVVEEDEPPALSTDSGTGTSPGTENNAAAGASNSPGFDPVTPTQAPERNPTPVAEQPARRHGSEASAAAPDVTRHIASVMHRGADAGQVAADQAVSAATTGAPEAFVSRLLSMPTKAGDRAAGYTEQLEGLLQGRKAVLDVLLARLQHDVPGARQLFARLPERLARRLRLALQTRIADSAAALLGLIRGHLLAGREASDTTVGDFMRTIEGHAAEASRPESFLRQIIQALVQERAVDLPVILAEEGASSAEDDDGPLPPQPPVAGASETAGDSGGDGPAAPVFGPAGFKMIRSASPAAREEFRAQADRAKFVPLATDKWTSRSSLEATAGSDAPSPSVPPLAATHGERVDNLLHSGTRAVLEELLAALQRAPTRMDSFIVRQSEGTLARLLYRLRAAEHAQIQGCADLIIGAWLSARLTFGNAGLRLTKWRFILGRWLKQGLRFEYGVFTRDCVLAIAREVPVSNRRRALGSLKRHLEKGVTPANQKHVAAIREAVDDLLSDEVTVAAHAPEPRAPENAPSWALLGDESVAAGDPIYVDNAGLILAAPYMPRLFRMLNLAESDRFTTEGAAERAVHLLQYLVDGKKSSPEFGLVLNKILCGLALDFPVDGQIELTDDECETAESLLHGMLQNWKGIGGTSVEGLRVSFLEREGRLQLKDDTWHLLVSPKPFDMLLDPLPWSVSVVKHSWMERAIHVNWR